MLAAVGGRRDNNSDNSFRLRKPDRCCRWSLHQFGTQAPAVANRAERPLF
jgi:hypothetical protein